MNSLEATGQSLIQNMTEFKQGGFKIKISHNLGEEMMNRPLRLEFAGALHPHIMGPALSFVCQYFQSKNVVSSQITG